MKTVRVLKLYLILIIFFGSFPYCTYSQLPELRNYNVKDGLPSSETYAIVQTNDGYIYIGTDRGLVRFDGDEFKTFTTANGLKDNTIFNLFKHKNDLWYYTYSAELGYLSADKKFHNYKYNSVIQKSIFSVIWSNLMFNDNGEILLNTPIYSVLRVYRITADGHLESKLFEDKGSLNIYMTPQATCLVAGSLQAPRLKLYDRPGGSLLADIQNQGTTKQVFASKIGSTTILHANQGLYKITNDYITRIADCPAHALNMFVDSRQDVWLSFKFHGVYHYKKNENYINPEKLLKDLSVSGITEDREKGMWFTTLENGVYYFPSQRIYSQSALNKSYTRTLDLEYIKNTIYARQSDYSLMSYDAINNTWNNVFRNRNVMSIKNSGDSLLLYSVTGQSRNEQKAGMQFIDYNMKLLYGGKHTWVAGPGLRYYEGERFKGSVPIQTSIITCGIELNDSTLLTGTLKGLFVCKNDSLIKINNKDIGASRIAYLQSFNDSLILVCTQSNGVYIIRLSDYGTIKRITSIYTAKNLVYNTVHRDKDNIIWIGTNMGVCRVTGMPGNNLTKQWININNGLASNEVYDIVSAGEDTWIATAGGISIIPPRTMLDYNYNIPLVLQSVTVNGQPSFLPTGDFNYTQNNITISFKGLSFLYAGKLRYKYRLMQSGKEMWKYADIPVINYNNLSPGKYKFQFAALAPNQTGKIRTATYTFTIHPPFWQTTWFFLLVIVLLLGGLYLFFHLRIQFVKKQLKLKSDLATYRDKALRDQMSPHFIYNSLNAIQNYIVKNDEDSSVNFLSKFSKLMRLIFHNTAKELVTIEQDMEALKLYVAMESMRFPGKFEVQFPDISGDTIRTLIPPLLLQPFVENAILHGILPSGRAGIITIGIEKTNKAIHVTIKDNGIGRKAASEIKANKNKFSHTDEEKQKGHSATTVTAVRIAQAWGITTNTYFSIKDLYNNQGAATGTLVEFYLPLHT